MIDVIINEAGGVTVAHTLKSLDGCDALDIDASSGAAVLSGPDVSRSIGTLHPSMLGMLRPGMTGRSIRTSGWSIARVGALAVRVAH